jgi:hypothetical protein
VWVLEPGGEANLALEALGPEGGGKLRAQDFQRNQAVVFEVASEVDSRHAPAPELALEQVAVAESVT